MYKDVVIYGSQQYDVKFLYDKEPAVDESTEPLWCIEKHRKIPNLVKDSCSEGSIRSHKCHQVTSQKHYMCTACEKVPQINAFRQQVLRHAEEKLKDRNLCEGSGHCFNNEAKIPTVEETADKIPVMGYGDTSVKAEVDSEAQRN